ncbi:PREDICTED: uncharacterized protein LOC108663271 [Theobroma cacao]|uniref:Uncharacterized protein LOC108663271 n=1 Tax=Theobroma cacao TaxID=3641 RepID=A0AB32WSS6_THECC|nr:PREDICTED: uncharacterized protein LOC108663271 [Theobroma cacao]
MDDNETIREFSRKMMGIVNQLRLLGKEMDEERLVSKMLGSLPEKYESKISSLEDFRDLNQMTLKELVNTLEGLEQKRSFKQKGIPKSALAAKTKNLKPSNGSSMRNEVRKKDKSKKIDEKGHGEQKKKFPPCSHCKNANHTEKFCWFKPNVKCRRCQQQGHMEKVCKSKDKTTDEKVAVVEELQANEKILFMTPTSRKLIYHVYFAPNVSQNLLIVGQLVDDNYMLVFKDKTCIVSDSAGGPMKTESLNGSIFYLLFIDDVTKFNWIYFLKRKFEASNVFAKLKALVENQPSQTIKKNRTSERKNRTIMEMARCLLFEMSLLKYMWAEAANTANCLLSIAQTIALPNKTPYEAWFNVKPSVNHLKVFGCICYSKIPDAKRGKLDEKSLVVVHLGYNQVSKGYRVFDVKTRREFVNRDMRFDEATK